MKKTSIYQRIIALVLIVALLVPSNVGIIFAAADFGNLFSGAGAGDAGTSAQAGTSSTPVTSGTSGDGLSIQLQWADGAFTDGTAFHLVEDIETSNAVRLKVSYSCTKVRAEGYKAGDLIVTVKGIGNVKRDEILAAVVGADKEGSASKSRDWTYSWNKATDTYTLYNNEPIEGNSVFSGYFELVWEVRSRDSVNGYAQDDIQAFMYLPDGNVLETPCLSFSNQTVADTFETYIEQEKMYSYEGLTEGIENPKDYVFVRYNLGAAMKRKARGLESSYYLFDPDSTNVGSGAIVISPNLYCQDNGDGTYQVSLQYLSKSVLLEDQYLFVAYPKSTDKYGDKNVYASLTKYGAYYEGDDSGNTGVLQLATASVGVPVPKDFTFTDIPGDIYQYWKDTYYDKYVEDEVTEEKGGDIAGSKLQTGTTETFYLEGLLNNPNGRDYVLEMIDDYLYILQNNGDYRQLNAGEYEFKTVTIPATSSLKNLNNVSIKSGVYQALVYAVQNGKKIDTKGDALVWSGVIKNTAQKVELPAGTTAIAVVLVDIKESIKRFSIPVEVAFHIEDTSALPWEQRDNLTSGQLVNTSFIKLHAKNQDGSYSWVNDIFTEDNYIDDTNLHLAEKDLAGYGSYLDREEDSLALFPGDKDNYYAFTLVYPITEEGSKLVTTVTIGADFAFADSTTNQFSLYTILPEVLDLQGYRIAEDIWDILSFSGLDMTEEQLADACTPEIIQDYQGSGRTYVALHFDFGDTSVPKDGSIRARLKTKVDAALLKESSTINVKSAVIIDKPIHEYQIDKGVDDGSWVNTEALFADIDRDGDAEESLAFDYYNIAHIHADSSQFEISKYVETTYSDGMVQMPDVPAEEYGGNYRYYLSVRNGNSTSTNIVVTDILETGTGAQWQGEFVSVDLSACEKLGLTGTVYYSSSVSPGALDSGNWSVTRPADVKAIAVDFGSSVLKEGRELVIEVNMKAPTVPALKNKVTENEFTVSMTMKDSGSGNVTTYGNLKSNPVRVKLTPALRAVVVTKVDAVDGSVLEGAEFELVDKATGEVLGKAVSNAKGYAIFHDVPAGGVYILREVQAPYGYNKAAEREITVADSSVYITVENPRMTGRVEIYKTNHLSDDLAVAGAEYTLYDAAGNAVATAVTDANGCAVFSNIPWGSYVMKETKSPDGYMLNETEYRVDVTRENVAQVQVFRVTDPQDDVIVTLQKYAATTKGEHTTVPLAGAVFELVRVTEAGDKRVGLYVTGKDGKILITELPYGDYYFREYRAPVGYEAAENVSFTLSKDRKEVSLTVYDRRMPGSVILTKQDNLGNIVPGVKFALYDASKTKEVAEGVTDAYGVMRLDGLEWGTYYLLETECPAYYVLNTEYKKVEINADALVVNVHFINETVKGSVILTKTDESGSILLPGAEYALFKTNGTLIGSYTTDAKGQIQVNGLEWGSYYFKELVAPAGYGLSNETVRFSVNALNAGVTQELTAADSLKTSTITLTKRIKAKDINFANGDPTFLFKVEGIDVNGVQHTYYRIVVMDEAYVKANTQPDGFVAQSTAIADLTAGTYVATEEDVSRYSLTEILEVVNGVKQASGSAVQFTLAGADNGAAVFINTKYESQDFSENDSIINILKKSVKLTALKVAYGADIVEAESFVNTDILSVVAIYDDGTMKTLTDTEYVLSLKQFPNQNGEYTVKVSYEENGIAKSGTFTVNLFGMKRRIVSLSAEMKDGSAVKAGDPLSPDMFVVTAQYNDGTSRVLTYGATLQDPAFAPVTIQSPGYPEQYPSDMTEEENFWEQTFPGADTIMVSFSNDSEIEHGYDWVQIYDAEGTSLFGQLSSPDIAGRTYLVKGEYVKLAMASDYMVQMKGFSATVCAVNETELEYTITPVQAPSTDGQFTVTVSLNLDTVPNDGYEVETTVSLLAEHPDPVLLKGETFKNKVPGTATSVVFTDIVAPEGATLVDVSAAKNGSVMAWLGVTEDDATVFYVSSQRGGVKVIANDNSKYMFQKKTALTSVDFTMLDNFTKLPGSIFSQCTGLITFTVPDGITEIGDSAFYNCKNLESVVIPNSVTKIGQTAFQNCTALKSVDLPDNLTYLGMYAFNGCSSLTSVEVPASVEVIQSYAFATCTSLTTVTLHEGLKELDAGVFKGNKKMVNITLPGTLQRIGAQAFNNCSALKSINIPNSVTTLESEAFRNCSGATSLVIGDGISEISEYAFSGCSGLTSITFGKNVTVIGKSSFYQCTKMTSLVIPEGVTTIGNAAFESWHQLVSVEIPDTVTSIGINAFYTCLKLESITIPASVTLIRENAFGRCNKLAAIVVDNDNSNYCDVNGVLFTKDMKTLVAYPAGNTNTAYTVPNGVTTIENNAFFYHPTLQQVSLPDTLVSIGENAFSYCEKLTSITIPNSVQMLWTNAFANCKGLTSVVIPGSVKLIDFGAFQNCSGLVTVEIKDGVETIDGAAFSRCTSLQSVIIPASVSSIGDGAFENCTALTNVYYAGTEAQWAAITVEDSNTPLTDAAIVYNYVG